MVEEPSGVTKKGRSVRRIAVFMFGPIVRGESGYTTDATFPHMLEALLDRGITVDLCAPVIEGAPAHEDLDPRLRVVRLPGFSTGWSKYVWTLPASLAAIARIAPRYNQPGDVVWILDADIHSQYLLLVCRLCSIQSSLYLRSHYELMSQWRHTSGFRKPLAFIFSRWFRLSIPRMARAVPTVAAGSEMAEHYGGRQADIHPFFSTLVRRENRSAPTRTERDPRIPLRLLVVGRMVPSKGIEILLHALGSLPRECSWSARLVGPCDAHYQSTLTAIANALGIEDRVTFAGRIPFGDRLWAEYENADVFVFPTLHEGTPKVVTEAMSRGLPVVASDVGSIRELIGDGLAGILVPPHDPGQLASAIQKIATDESLRRRLSSAAISQASFFTLDAQVDGLLDFFERRFG